MGNKLGFSCFRAVIIALIVSKGKMSKAQQTTSHNNARGEIFDKAKQYASLQDEKILKAEIEKLRIENMML